MKKVINSNTITFTFNDGVAPVMFDATKVASNLREYAEMHGWAAKLGDGAAISTKRADGDCRPVTEAERREAIAEAVEYFQGGATTWNRAERGPRAPVQNAVILGLATAWGVTYAEAEARLANAELAAMMHPGRVSL